MWTYRGDIESPKILRLNSWRSRTSERPGGTWNSRVVSFLEFLGEGVDGLPDGQNSKMSGISRRQNSNTFYLFPVHVDSEGVNSPSPKFYGVREFSGQTLYNETFSNF